MPIPPLDQDGFLPVGVHDCTLQDIAAVFGRFQVSDRRPKLFEKLQSFLREAAASGITRSIIVDGSFVTAADRPNDIDLIVVLDPAHDFSTDIKPSAYNVLSKQRVRARFGFDVLVAREGSLEYDRWTEYFQQIRLEPGRRKGILRLRL